MLQSKLTRVLASGFVIAGGAATFTWLWPEDDTLFPSTVAVLSALISLLVVASLWRR
jgi:hypothetical protein